MSRLLLCTVALAGLATAPIPAVRQAKSPHAAIRTELKRMADAWNAGSLAGHVAPYADSATMMGGRGPIAGRDTIQSLIKRSFWKDEKPVQQLRFDSVVIRPLGNAHALATGHFILSGGGTED